MGKGKNMQTQDNIEKETKESLRSPPSQNDPLVNKVGVQGYQ